MGLKQSIVIVNEYTIKTKTGNGGSRGGSPGDYVLRYMVRDSAVEDLTPVRLNDLDSYVMRYMARKEATDTEVSVPAIKRKMRSAQGFGGISFGSINGKVDASMSDRTIREVSKDIQSYFDSGNTCLKTVLSFDEDYLKKTGVIDPDFEFKKKGDYRGNLDQMKLRLAIMSGVKKMGRSYDKLMWVGTIQVDTDHVHCHLCIVDTGKGKLASDGTQKGKISKKSKRDLRRGIDMFLDENQTVRQMSSNITHDKRNALCHIKKFTHKTMDKQGVPQFLLACLPDDKTLWRAGTNNKAMRKANAIVSQYVTQVLDEPGSGYTDALLHINEYAASRAKNENLSDKEHRELIQNGQGRMLHDCMNGVYGILKQIPESAKSVRTPMMEAMAMDYETMAAQVDNDPMMEFGFKLRSYSGRLSHYKNQTHQYRDAVRNYDASENVSEDSKPLYDYFRFETDYNAMLMCKYQYFLSFLPPGDEYENDFHDLMAYQQKIQDLSNLNDDPSIRRMKPDSAEDYGLRVYNQHGGQYAVGAPQIIERRLDMMSQTYLKKEDVFRDKLADYGMTLDDKGVSYKKPYEFDQVKALDLHHLKYDFSRNVPVSLVNTQKFVAMSMKRYELFEQAATYLTASGQSDMLSLLPTNDVLLMRDVATRMQADSVLVVKQPIEGSKRAVRTTSLSVDYSQDMALMVRATVLSAQFE